MIWLSFVPAHGIYLTCIDAREDPPFEENMAVPIEGALTTIFGLFVLPFILIGVWLVTANTSLPVPLWPGRSNERASFLLIPIWIALLAALIITAFGIIGEPPIVPSCVSTIYLLLCGRASLASPKRIREAPEFEVIPMADRNTLPIPPSDKLMP